MYYCQVADGIVVHAWLVCGHSLTVWMAVRIHMRRATDWCQFRVLADFRPMSAGIRSRTPPLPCSGYALLKTDSCIAVITSLYQWLLCDCHRARNINRTALYHANTALQTFQTQKHDPAKSMFGLDKAAEIWLPTIKAVPTKPQGDYNRLHQLYVLFFLSASGW